MTLQDIVPRDLIIENLTATRHADALRDMLTELGRRFGWKPGRVEDYLFEVLRRHALMPSGLGRGLAFPNARLADMSEPILMIGLSQRGLDFQAADRSLAHVVLLYLGRARPPEEERRFLSDLSAALQDGKFVELLRQATTTDEVWQSITVFDEKHPAHGKEANDRGVQHAIDRVHIP